MYFIVNVFFFVSVQVVQISFKYKSTSLFAKLMYQVVFIVCPDHGQLLL